MDFAITNNTELERGPLTWGDARRLTGIVNKMPPALPHALPDGRVLREYRRENVEPAEYQEVHEGEGALSESGVWLVNMVLVDVPLDQAKAKAANTVQQMAESALLAMVAGYPERERETWPIQVSEAEALVADAAAPAPFLRKRAELRGADPVDFANIVLAKNEEYRIGAASVLGTADMLQAQIEAAADLDALRTIDLTSGWPA